MAVSGEDSMNPGDKMAVTLDVGYSSKIGKIQGSTVEAVTVQDIMEKIQALSYIIKTDIQKYDCKVYQFLAARNSSIQVQGLPLFLFSSF